MKPDINEMKNIEENDPVTFSPSHRLTLETETILAVLRLSRSLKRCPPEHGERPFPPAVGRMLGCVRANPGVSSRELCELLDLRPSSLSELLTRAEKEGWITRIPDEEDKRMQHVSLCEKGSRLAEGMDSEREADARKKTACFSDEEKALLIQLCNRLSDHLESLSLDLPEDTEWQERKRPRWKRDERGPEDPHRGPRHRNFPPDRKPPRGPLPSDSDDEPEERRENQPWRPPFPPNARIKC